MNLPLKHFAPFISKALFQILSLRLLAILCGCITAQTVLAQDALPKPTGPYGVGRMVLRMTDASRFDVATPNDPTDKRRLAVLLWYPTDPSAEGVRAPFTHHLTEFAKILSAAAPNLPLSSIVKGLRSLRPWAIINPSFAMEVEKAPLILMSHGLGSIPEEYESLAEELVSFGFVVAGVNHTYGSTASMYLSGSPEYALADVDQHAYDDEPKIMKKYERQWSEDLRFVLTELQRLNQDQDSRLFGKLDMNRVGAIGHSFGGAASVAAAQRDERILCAADLDGLLWEIGLNAPPSKPVMLFETSLIEFKMSNYPLKPSVEFLQSGNLTLDEYHRFRRYKMRQLSALNRITEAGGVMVKYPGADHLAFSDYTLIGGVSAGQVDAQRAHFVINTYVRAFLDEHLRGTSSDLLRNPSLDFPEINVVLPEGQHPSN